MNEYLKTALICVASMLLLGTAQAEDNHLLGDAAKDVPIFDAHIHYK